MFEFLKCPICDTPLNYPLPESCSNCGKRNLRHDLSLVPTMHNIDPYIETVYLKWIQKSRTFFKAKKQYYSIIDEINFLKNEIQEVKKSSISSLLNVLFTITGTVNNDLLKEVIEEKKENLIIKENNYLSYQDLKLEEYKEDILNEIIVGKNSKYNTITEAINSASNGTRIKILPGKYKEDIIIDKEIELTGDGNVNQIIIENKLKNTILVKSNKFKISGITLKGKERIKDKSFFTLDINQSKGIIENCIISSDAIACVSVHGNNKDIKIIEEIKEELGIQ